MTRRRVRVFCLLLLVLGTAGCQFFQNEFFTLDPTPPPPPPVQAQPW
ncbi:MAG: hypothetical protein IT458_06600 [Planctomycetes bacterium]|nr:hypothetical protein [Planctomycetota bacterium]